MAEMQTEEKLEEVVSADAAIDLREKVAVPHDFSEAKRAIEAIVLVSASPVPEQLLAQLLELSVNVIAKHCQELADDYDARRSGFSFAHVAGGWRYQTREDLAEYVERFAMEGSATRLSSAALETLSIVAYKQPLSRSQVSAIRGVNADGVLRTLLQRGYIEEKGQDDGPGQATLLGTSQFFLEQLGLPSLASLPPLGDFVPSAQMVEALEQTLLVGDESEPSAEAQSKEDIAVVEGAGSEQSESEQSELGQPEDNAAA